MLSPHIQERTFWSLSVTETAQLLETDIQRGITEQEAEQRRVLFGMNTFERPRRLPGFAILINQLRSPLILVLIAASSITLFLGHLRDALFILAAVVVNTALGFYQEHKAERALAELKTYLKQRVRVIRGGVEHDLDADMLVPGDLIRLSQGDRVPADARVLFANDVHIDESILTGESLPVSKHTESVDGAAVIGDQQSMIFAGTLCTQGVATAIVCRTDNMTEIGKIADLVAKSENEETPLQKSIRRFSFKATLFLGALTVIIFFIGVASGQSVSAMFLTSVAIAVSAIPEGLPVALTVILAVGVERMARRNGVVRKLVAAETLGSTTVILTDKTGTLTMAKMELARVIPIGVESERDVLQLALLNTEVLIENEKESPEVWHMDGRVLEVALVRGAALRGISPADTKAYGTVIQSQPFNSVHKFSIAQVQQKGKKQHIIFFGAPDILVMRSACSAEKRAELLARIDELARAGERVLGVASKGIASPHGFSFDDEALQDNLSFDGLITFRDPVRPGVAGALRRVTEAGIRTIIVTGDHRGTAEAIAREVGMHISEGSVIDATELAHMDDLALRKILPTLSVIARVTPVDKARIVTVLQGMGEVVAMTGDGINDAPSIKQADVGIAMGSGTEVSQSVADLVLMDDNFETIVAAVDEGRQILNNVRKVIVYLLSSVTDALLLIGGALLTGLPLPLNALQILWVNFFSDSFPAVAFAFEKGIDGLSLRRRSPRQTLFDPVMRFLILVVGGATTLLLFGLYWFLLRSGFDQVLVQTFIFAAFGSYTLFLPFSIRSLEKSIFAYNPFSNMFLVAGSMIGIVLMIVAIYTPFMQTILGTVALPASWALVVVCIGILNIIAVEFGKALFRPKRVTI